MIDEILVEDGKVVGVAYSYPSSMEQSGYRNHRGQPYVGKSSETSSTHQVPNHSLASINLADNLKELGLEIGRFKTGTLHVSRLPHQLRCDRNSARR